jgi:predicted transposase YbfD/YdcC
VSHTIHLVNGGYLPFGSFPSDHRCLWIDISTANAFGYNPPSSPKHQARQLKSDNPIVHNKWLTIYEAFICSHHLHTRQFQLESTINGTLTDEQIEEYEYIIKMRMKGIEEANLKCRKLHMGNVPFSAKYKELTNKIELWKAVVTKKRHCKFSQGKLRRLEKSTGTPNSLHCSLQDAQDRLKLAFDAYWKFKKKCSDRTECLHGRESSSNRKRIRIRKSNHN